jgi:hypothetical protein
MADTSAIVKSTLDTKTKSRRICKRRLTFSQDFHLAVLVWCRLYIKPPPCEFARKCSGTGDPRASPPLYSPQTLI